MMCLHINREIYIDLKGKFLLEVFFRQKHRYSFYLFGNGVSLSREETVICEDCVSCSELI